MRRHNDVCGIFMVLHHDHCNGAKQADADFLFSENPSRSKQARISSETLPLYAHHYTTLKMRSTAEREVGHLEQWAIGSGTLRSLECVSVWNTHHHRSFVGYAPVQVRGRSKLGV